MKATVTTISGQKYECEGDWCPFAVEMFTEMLEPGSSTQTEMLRCEGEDVIYIPMELVKTIEITEAW